VQSSTRKNLKQDKFASAVGDQIHWTVEHRGTVMRILIAVLVVLVAAIGFSLYIDTRNEAANTAFGAAMQTYEAQLRTADAPVVPNVESFTSAKERATAAHKKFAQIANDYPFTKIAKMSLYLSGVTALEMGDNATGEKELKDAAGSMNSDVASLAHFALASYYRDNKKEPEAIAEYNAVISANTMSVPRTTAQLELAAFYEAQKKPTDAIKIYEEVQKDGTTQPETPKTDKNNKDAKDNKTPAKAPEPVLSAAAQVAKDKIEKLKKGAADAIPTPAPAQKP
jgi:hypothetical protein